MTAEEATEEEVKARRFALHLRLAELAELAARTAVQVKAWEEPAAWERALAHKWTAVREASALLHAAQL